MQRLCMRILSQRLVRASIAAAVLLFLPLAALPSVAQATNGGPPTPVGPVTPDPELAQVAVEDGAGAPLAGMQVQILVIPQDMTTSDETDEPLAGTGTIDAQGHVTTSLTAPALTDTALVSPNGYVNYEMQVADGDGNLLIDYYFSRYYGSDPNIASEMPTLAGTQLVASDVVAGGLATANPPPDGYPLPPCPWVTVSQTDAYTVVGELHTVTDLSGTFSYGQTADSEIGVSVSLDGGGHWSLSGSSSVSNTLSSKITQGNQAANWGHQIKTQFHYLKQKQSGCNHPTWYRVIASQWDGGIQIGADVSSWDNHPNQWKQAYPGRSEFLRSSGTAYNYGIAVNVFNINLNATSGFSTNVELHWTNTSQSTTRYLYGNNGYPTTATIIYASLK